MIEITGNRLREELARRDSRDHGVSLRKEEPDLNEGCDPFELCDLIREKQVEGICGLIIDIDNLIDELFRALGKIDDVVFFELVARKVRGEDRYEFEGWYASTMLALAVVNAAENMNSLFVKDTAFVGNVVDDILEKASKDIFDIKSYVLEFAAKHYVYEEEGYFTADDIEVIVKS
jgi:hypothetical protein